jgi:hypothetical protein
MLYDLERVEAKWDEITHNLLAYLTINYTQEVVGESSNVDFIRRQRLIVDENGAVNDQFRKFLDPKFWRNNDGSLKNIEIREGSAESCKINI